MTYTEEFTTLLTSGFVTFILAATVIIVSQLLMRLLALILNLFGVDTEG